MLIPCRNLPYVNFLVTSSKQIPSDFTWLCCLSETFRDSTKNNLWPHIISRISPSLYHYMQLQFCKFLHPWIIPYPPWTLALLTQFLFQLTFFNCPSTVSIIITFIISSEYYIVVFVLYIPYHNIFTPPNFPTHTGHDSLWKFCLILLP